MPAPCSARLRRAITSSTVICADASRRCQHPRFGAPRSPRHRIRRTEQHHHRHAERRRDMRRSAVVADEQAARPPSGSSRSPAERCETLEILRNGAASSPGPARIIGSSPALAVLGNLDKRSSGQVFQEPTQTDASPRKRQQAGLSPGAISLARGISVRGTPSQNIADAKCSAVCTGRSSPKISCARGILCE